MPDKGLDCKNTPFEGLALTGLWRIDGGWGTGLLWRMGKYNLILYVSIVP